MAAQPSLQRSLLTLLHGLLSRTGATRAVLLWYEDGHAGQALEAHGPGAGGQQPSGHQNGSAPDALLRDAAEEAIDQGIAVGSDAGGDAGEWLNRAQQALAQASNQSVLTVPLPGGADPMGAVLLFWQQADTGPCDPGIPVISGWLAGVAPLLAAQRRAERPWHWHARQAWRQRRQRWRQDTPRLQRHLWAAGGLALLALAIVPLPDRIGGQARIEGAQQRVLSAPTDGFIKATHVHPGDRVKAGQVLADLAEQDLKLERDRWASQVAQQDNSYAAAMTRADRAEAALSLSRLEEAQAQLALIDEQLKRSQLKAPFDGIVIQGDLSQSIGAPVKQGDTLMTVASTRRFRVVIDIDEGDIARLQAGQTGSIALSALPWDTLDLKVVRITALGVARDGRNVFEVQADFNQPLPADIRPGLTGQAKVMVGWRPLLWSWARPLVNRLRFLWWAW
ncbi:MAG TPA: efflux RND transporter periplasmic adaptor subunit [Candidatus Aquabacterium excrementipullorum]|nr:efflux RND transporter periplasmic adaptor subunit [Candidatus Aquabacterium excrementipullorum]